MKKLIFIIFIFICFISCERHEYRHEWELLNMGDKEGVTGSFFLGCGSINTQLYYIGYVKSETGIHRLKITNLARIHYTNKKPKLVLTYIARHEEHDELGFYIEYGSTGWGKNTAFIDIFIPEGSIKENYSLGE